MRPGARRATGRHRGATWGANLFLPLGLTAALLAGCSQAHVTARTGPEQIRSAGTTDGTGADPNGGGTPSDSEPVADPQAGTSGDATQASSPGASVARLPSAAAPAAPIPRFVCPEATVRVSDAKQLAAALKAATPGQVIRLNDATFTGRFVAGSSGTSATPIYLCGGRGAVIDGGSVTGGYALHFDQASHWRVSGFTVRNGQKGVMVDTGTDIGLQDLLVEHLGDEAVHLRKNSTGNVLRGLTIRDTGNRRDKFGEGIYIGSAQSNWSSVTGGQPDTSDRNFILENAISTTTAESVDIKEGTTGGVLAGNTFDGSRLSGADSWVDAKGNGWLIAGNTGHTTIKDGFQTHVVVDGWGDRNIFHGNLADLRAGSGVGFYLHEPLNNRVDCSNRVSGGSLSNHPCTG